VLDAPIAGNVVDCAVQLSVEFAVVVLHVPFAGYVVDCAVQLLVESAVAVLHVPFAAYVVVSYEDTGSKRRGERIANWESFILKEENGALQLLSSVCGW